jgi:hypothetical protein
MIGRSPHPIFALASPAMANLPLPPRAADQGWIAHTAHVYETAMSEAENAGTSRPAAPHMPDSRPAAALHEPDRGRADLHLMLSDVVL